MNEKYTGLKSKEVNDRLSKYGKNILLKTKKKSLFVLFFKQLANPMIIVLLISAMLSYIISLINNQSITDVIIILIVVLLNTLLGVIQEYKAEKAILALSKLTPKSSKVIRDGSVKEILSEDIVIDDILLINTGDIIPADGYLLENHSINCDESTLTGESIPIEKDLKDNNTIYMGSVITYGKGIMKVTQTGMNTEIGKIAHIINSAKNSDTPLQKRLNKLSKLLTIFVLLICIIMFVISLFKAKSITFNFIIDAFMLSISLAVAAIPEGLAAVVTIILSIGVTKMAKQKAIIRKLTAVETLGCVEVICTDKTGTLTKNKMKVEKYYTHNHLLLNKIIYYCNDSKLSGKKYIGESTEIALKKYSSNYIINENQDRIDELPFDSNRKMMSTIHKNGNYYVQYTKGAIDSIINKTSFILSENGVIPINENLKNEILNINHQFASEGLRVIACAYKDYWFKPSSSDKTIVEDNLVFVGLVGLIDPIRDEVFNSINTCKKAGITVMMITGDHLDTAVAIGKKINLLENNNQALSGFELDQLSDDVLNNCILNYRVFARVTPTHKTRIIKTLQIKNKIVAMTGDGVNDAPSIKTADIGISMGIMGTDVTKDSADMILADDNFSTIVQAVEEGRKIYTNIDKTIHFLLSSNLSEVFTILIATIIGFTILDPAHILWINLITDSIPALALGMENKEPDIMNKKPRSINSNLFNKKTWFDIFYQGIIVSLLTITSFLIGCKLDSGNMFSFNSLLGKTMAFLTMSMAEVFHAFNLRSKNSSIFKIKNNNKYLWFGCFIAIVLTTSVIYLPFLSNIFGFVKLKYYHFAMSFGLGFSIIPIVEIMKYFFTIEINN